MYDQVSSSPPTTNNISSLKLPPLLSTLLWLVVGAALVGYGLLAFDSGTKISPALNPIPNGGPAIERILSEAEQGPIIMNVDEVEQFVPTWINIIADIESDEYAYGRDSVLPIEEHYLSMPESERHVLSTHMLLGIVLMGAGFLQFWPSFRRKYRKAHRFFGVLYVGAGFTSMAMSGYYLAVTDIADIYSTYVFYVGLWGMLVSSVLGLSMAGYAIYKRDIARHLGWQAIAFGFFLTAPTQRIYWIFLSPFSDGATFNEMNIVVNVLLFAQASLFGYLLFLVNRASSPIRRTITDNVTVSEARPITQWMARLLPVSALVVLSWFYLIDSGMQSSSEIMRIVPATAATSHDVILVSITPLLLIGALTSVLVFGFKLIVTPFTSRMESPMAQSTKFSTFAVAVSGIAAAAILCLWGYELGLPSHSKSLSGVFYMSTGLLMLVFLSIFIYNSIMTRLANNFSNSKLSEYSKSAAHNFSFMKEILLFIVMLALAPVVQIVLLQLFGLIDFIPEQYRLEGHGYQMAAAFSLFLAIIVPFVSAIYSSHTNRYAVN